jgi:hypothetical protein
MTLDLSEITESLIGLVKDQWSTAPIWTQLGGSPTFTPNWNFSGLAPDLAKQQAGPQLSMYLYHVESDNAREAMFWQPWMQDAGGQPIRFTPFALNLFYLLFAYSESETGWTQEQEAMSVALRIYHANPIVRSDPGATVPWELTLTMEHRSYDELSRLWQATTVPLRMSVVYRAAVVFIDPDPMPENVTIAKTKLFTLSADPVQLPLPPPGPNDYPVLFGTSRQGSYSDPTGVAEPFSLSNVALEPGQSASLLGSDLGADGQSDTVYLLAADGTDEVDVTAWTVPADSTATKFALKLPATVGTPPADSPAPGVYQMRVGSGALGSPGATRSGSISVTVAAFVDQSGGSLLSGSAPFTAQGAGFTAGKTEVLVGTTALAVVTAAPTTGQVRLDPSGTSFAFAPPAGPAGLVLPVRVRVNGIESQPALWVTL